MSNHTYNFANDLGYSSIKMQINGKKDIMPSVVAIQRQQNFTKPIEFGSKNEEAIYYKNLSKHLDLTINSPAVSLQGRFLVGERALNSGLITRTFDVNDGYGKSETDLSVILTLARLASQRVTDAYFNHENLQQIIKMNVNMATALPINEGKIKGVTDKYTQRYMQGRHLVTLYNFKEPITVEINFLNTYVGFEGEVAQFKIVNADSQLKSFIKRDFDQSYPEVKDEITADELIQLPNVIGIDVGEGTTDFSVIINGVANANASTSLSQGYGNVLQDAVEVLNAGGFNFKSRDDLSNYISQNVSPLSRGRQKHVKEVVQDQLDPLVQSIITTMSQTMNQSGSDIELVYVYGGGSIPLLKQTDMRQQLIEKLKSFSGGFDIPVIFIDPSRARTLNENGLELILQNSFAS